MDMQQRAVELAKSNSFGVEALDLNLQITRDDPSNQGAWTRLARCYLEQRRFADAAGAWRRCWTSTLRIRSRRAC